MNAEKLMPRVGFDCLASGRFSLVSDPDDLDVFSASFLSSRSFSLGVFVDLERVSPGEAVFFLGEGVNASSTVAGDSFLAESFFGVGAAPQKPQEEPAPVRSTRARSFLTGFFSSGGGVGRLGGSGASGASTKISSIFTILDFGIAFLSSFAFLTGGISGAAGKSSRTIRSSSSPNAPGKLPGTVSFNFFSSTGGESSFFLLCLDVLADAVFDLVLESFFFASFGDSSTGGGGGGGGISRSLAGCGPALNLSAFSSFLFASNALILAATDDDAVGLLFEAAVDIVFEGLVMGVGS